jgi:hypothetical protein
MARWQLSNCWPLHLIEMNQSVERRLATHHGNRIAARNQIPFRTDVERSEKTPGGEGSKVSGESKLKSAIEKSGRPVLAEAARAVGEKVRGYRS